MTMSISRSPLPLSVKKNVVEARKKCGVKRLVYASSVDAYPPLPDNQVMREISHFNPEILDGWLLAVTSPASGVSDSHSVTGGVYKARERIHRGMLTRDY